MKMTKEQAAADQAEFDRAFDQQHEPGAEESDDAAFGLSADPAAGMDGTPVTPPEPESAAPGTPPAAGMAPAMPDRSAELDQREAALTAREAALASQATSSNVAETQNSREAGAGAVGADPADAANAGNDNQGAATATMGESDPGATLAEDFGQDFVQLITALIKQTCHAMVQEGVGGVSATVDHLIAELTSERQQNHFKSILAAHADFMEVTESPEFTTWQQAQPATEQAAIAHATEAGSAQEIIDVLTRFKASQAESCDAAASPALDASIHAAEGVRSSGVRLPKEPMAAGNYEDAWDEA